MSAMPIKFSNETGRSRDRGRGRGSVSPPETSLGLVEANATKSLVHSSPVPTSNVPAALAASDGDRRPVLQKNPRPQRIFTDKEILAGIDLKSQESINCYFPSQKRKKRMSPVSIRGCSDDYKVVFRELQELQKLGKEQYVERCNRDRKLSDQEKKRYRKAVTRLMKRITEFWDGGEEVAEDESKGDTQSGTNQEAQPQQRAPSLRQLVQHSAVRAAVEQYVESHIGLC